jgi:peptidoglycan/LPS O-acetylase OafA/YrhL
MVWNPALDGIRAFAIVVVMLFHARAPAAMGGYLGVDVFFVLSGFLITSLLLAELETRGRIDFSGFWRRRLVRLTPALLAMLVAYVLVAPIVWPGTTNHGTQAAVSALYLADYGVAWWGVPTQLSHTWSLAVEMHFYLLWPFLLLLAWRRWKGTSLASALLAGYSLATALRWFWTVHGHTWEQVYYRTDTRLSGLLLGACVAAALRETKWRERLRSATPWLLWIPIAAVVCLQYRWHDLWVVMWGIPLVEIATAAVLIASLRRGSQVSAMLSQPLLVWLGKLSYGLYLWHYPIFVYLRERYTWDVVLLAGVPLSVALAAVSYHTVEAWTARWRAPRLAARVHSGYG